MPRRTTDEFRFEWEVLRQQYKDSQNAILFKQKSAPNFAEFSPDGRWLACDHPDDCVSIYDFEKKSFRQLGNEPAGGAADLAFSADGKELITVSWTGVVNRREVSTSRVVGPIVNGGMEGERVGINQFQLSPDGKTAAVGMDNGTLILARLEEGECTRIAAHDGYIVAMAFSPDGSMLVSSGEDETLKFWDLNTNQRSRILNSGSPTWNIQFTSEGRRLVVCDSVHGVRVLDAASLAELRGLRSEPQEASILALYRDDILATVGPDDCIALWDMETGNRLATFVGHTGDVNHMRFSPDGMSLASASGDGTVRVWSVGRVIREAKDRIANSQNWHTELQFTADGQKLISCTRPSGPLVEAAGTFMNERNLATGESEVIVDQGLHGRSDLAVVPEHGALALWGTRRICTQKQAIGRTRSDLGPQSDARVPARCRLARWEMGGRLWTHSGPPSPGRVFGPHTEGKRLFRGGSKP